MSKYLLHHTSDGERWDQLAWRYYGNVSLQGQLVAANRHLFSADMIIPPFLSAGLVLTIPIIEQPDTTRELLPPWKQ